MYNLRFFSAIALAAVTTTFGNAQPDTVYLENASFEENYIVLTPGQSDWMDCGFLSENPPGYQPGRYDVNLPARHLDSYLSMVVRDNYTWDAVGQKLSKPLQSGRCYKMTISLAQAKHYIDYSRSVSGRVQYRNPLRLLIWGGSDYCRVGQLLDATDLIKNKDWETFTLYFQPDQPWTHITLHAYFLNPLAKAYNGHILIDHASAIISTECDPGEMPNIEGSDIISVMPRSLDELTHYITLHGKKIAFRPELGELMDEPSGGDHRATFESYAHCSIIMRGMQWFPQQRLVLAVKSKSQRVSDSRVRYLKQMARERGLTAQQVEVRRYQPGRDGQVKWLVKNQHLAIGLAGT